MKRLIAALIVAVLFAGASFAHKHKGTHVINRSDGYCWTHSDYCGDQIDKDGWCWEHSKYEDVIWEE